MTQRKSSYVLDHFEDSTYNMIMLPSDVSYWA